MRKRYFITLTEKVWRIFDLIFPVKGGFDFSGQDPAALAAGLPKCANLRGATALSDISSGRVSVALAYRHRIARSLVWQIKYKRDPYALRCGGYILYKEIAKKIERVKNRNVQNKSSISILIIPMPVSPARRRERGYNQCELLAEAVKSFENQFKLKIKIELRTNILLRKKNRAKQTFKNRQERLEGSHGIFEVKLREKDTRDMQDIQNVRFQKIFLLDDVITTGATLREAMDCLERAGFKNIEGLALAH